VKVCIYGAGAIGGYLGVKLASVGVDVCLIARGPHLAAIQKNGLTLREDGKETNIRIPCSKDPADFPPQDYVFVTVKAHAAPKIVDKVVPLLGPKTAVVPAVNGVPWWYFYKIGGQLEGRTIETVDPRGLQWNKIGPERVIGCVVYPAAEIPEPGVVQHVSLNRVPLGEPDGTRSDRVLELSQAMIAGGLKAPVRARIRDDIWVKLWGNMSFNPVSVLTGATLRQIGTDPGLRGLVREMMIEGQKIGEGLGVKFPVDIEKRINGAVEVGEHKTSTLHDFEAGKPIEIDALLGAVCELGRFVGVETPTMNLIWALTRQRAITAGCYSVEETKTSVP